MLGLSIRTLGEIIYIIKDEVDFVKAIKKSMYLLLPLITQMFKAETMNQSTILDYLNEDCWHAVLSYVPVADIILSETVSRQWQRVVLGYLQRARIGIEDPEEVNKVTLLNVRWLTLWLVNCNSFKSWTNKLGHSVVASHCDSEEILKIITENCPNLEAILLVALPKPLVLSIKNESFKCLRQLCFKYASVTDHCISQFIANNDMKEIEINGTDGVTGECFINIKSTNLESLVLSQCSALKLEHLLLAADRFSKLTKLELRCLPIEIYENIHLVLDKMHNLEFLHIFDPDILNPDVIRCHHLCASVCRLSNLKHIGWNVATTDEDLEALTRCCKELRSLEMDCQCDGVTPRGVAAVCRNAGARLTGLGFWFSKLTDDDVVACIRSCPNLVWLNLDGCRGVTAALPARAAAARRQLTAPAHALHLYMPAMCARDLRSFEELVVHIL